ncbi:hypothetical protein [Klebsiella variicola]|uniref:hypothetical protein n=1 Tax=Klebsiella variicola TaxID=244366 RepID=UPI002D775CFC|nr:hypothetical protein [Klebsiella variicola]WRP36390.1 hypothetical protein U1R81_20965 [Klebsiella variicola]
MSDEIETIDRNPKSWAAWKREAERLQKIIDGMALAAMDGEPVAFLTERNPGVEGYGPARRIVDAKQYNPLSEEYWSAGARENHRVTPLYRHAQPVPVVPDAYVRDEHGRMMLNGVCEPKIGFGTGWNACRAAMLQELKKSAGTEAICRSDENVQVLHTKSPAQSDCCPAQNVVVPAQSPIDHGYLPECECSGCKATARICAELSANSSENPDCWCRTCRPVVLNDMRFVVCPDCGNKRCPRANDHRNACTGSNEPGQEGSAYPDTLQEPKP